MPTGYPSANDIFAAPTSPATTTLSSAGDSSRNHSQSHQDLGDAIVALQKNVALQTHDHSNSEARPTSKLQQANTHESADTDATTSSLHHTIGTGSKQAAAGNHTHSDVNTALANANSALSTIRISAFGASTRTQAPLCSIICGGDRALIAGDVWQDAQFTVVDYDSDSMWKPGTVANGGGYIRIPITGYYECDFNAIVGGQATHYVNRIIFSNNAIPSGVTTNNLASDLMAVDTAWGGEPINLHARSSCRYLPAGMRIYFSIYCAASGATCYARGFGENRTMATVRMIAAAGDAK